MGGETDRACCTAQQKAARALHRTASDTTAVCPVPPLPNQSIKLEMVASKSNNIGIQQRSRPCSAGKGMAIRACGR
jgi:hypothetical protein